MFGLGFWEIFIILLIGLLVIGPKELPRLIVGFRRWMSKFQNLREDFEYEMQQSLIEIEHTSEHQVAEQKEISSRPDVTDNDTDNTDTDTNTNINEKQSNHDS